MNSFFEKLKDDASDLWQRTREAAAQIKDQEIGSLDAWHDLFAWADGSVMAYPFEQEDSSEKDQKLKTLAVMELKDDKIVSPCSGIVVSVSEKNNTIGISPAPEQIVAVKICPKCASLKKDDILVKDGQWVHTGQVLAQFHQPVQGKSKLLLVKPETWKQAKDNGAASARTAGAVSKGDLLIHNTKQNQ